MGLKLYNTLTRKKESFQPIDPANVRMYVCGPTVYQRIHIGNARPLIVFDVLFRLLRHLYGEQHVTYARNITDIDDKIIAQAEKNGESIESLTERTTRDFLADAEALGCLRPTHQPKATEHIGEMQAMIAKLIEQGHAYAADGHVLFNVPSMPAYGRLSGRNRDDQIAGARVEVAPYKRDPADFVLWKPSTPGQPGWESPWGRGRPGWHIECSAMSERWLGVPFDIHGGGLDLIFPHHENEIAQSCCVHGWASAPNIREKEDMAAVWMHNGFVEMSGEKMSKSLGNIMTVEAALSQSIYHPALSNAGRGEIIRTLMLSSNYRDPLSISQDAIVAAKRRLDGLYGRLHELREVKPVAPTSGLEAFIEALEDDLNTPEALAELSRIGDGVGKYYRSLSEDKWLLISAGLVLGILNDPNWRRGVRYEESINLAIAAAISADASMDTSAVIEMAIRARADARRIRDFAKADAIRKALSDVGIILEDRPNGKTDWRLA